jgi:hypothetical protein
VIISFPIEWHGRTLTAEAGEKNPKGWKANSSFRTVVEKLHTPFYSVSIGELGIDVNSVGSKLQTAFDLTKSLEALMLPNKAEVFLERSAISYLERNHLVSMFLRKLEYYNGVLLLTTNR